MKHVYSTGFGVMTPLKVKTDSRKDLKFEKKIVKNHWGGTYRVGTYSSGQKSFQNMALITVVGTYRSGTYNSGGV